jgi:hypothetical protein
MNRFRFSIIIIIAMSLLDFGCTHQRDGGGLNLSVKEVKIDSWLNLMFGGPNAFHIAGEIKLKNEKCCEIKNLQLSTITVTQLDKKLYSFAPAFAPKIENRDNVIPSEMEKEFLYNTKSGLPINKELDVELPVKLIMLFKENDVSFLYEIENIKVEKVY